MKSFSLVIILILLAISLAVQTTPAKALTFTVTNTLDAGAGSYRQALLDANGNPGIDTIEFAIGTVGSAQTITLASDLPALFSPVIIDGWSQGGVGYSGPPLIELNGNGAANVGVWLVGGSAGSTVRGLVINRFTIHGMIIQENSINNVVQGNYIGTNAAGTAASPNAIAGIVMQAGTTGNLIGTNADGTNDAAEANVISGNGTATGYGVAITGTSNNNTVAGNYIGTDVTNTLSIPNVEAGVFLAGAGLAPGPQSNLIGGTTSAARNFIRFNNTGITISSNSFATINNTVQGNTISNNTVGIFNLLTENSGLGAPGDGPNDNLIDNNLITNNSFVGINNQGSSPLIINNTISNSGGPGIYNQVYYGADTSPATANDDFLSLPVIGQAGGQNTLIGNCNGVIPCAAIFSLDTAPANSATIQSDNNAGTNNGFPLVEQRWYGAAEFIDGTTPIATTFTVDSSGGGPAYNLTANSGICAGLNNTILHDTDAISCTDVTTWTQYIEYIVDGAGTRVNYIPHTVLAPPTTYSYDGNAATDPTDSGFGFVGEGIQTGPFSRYQILEVRQVGATPTVTSTPTATATATPTSTETSTVTATLTLTETPTVTSTITLTETPTVTVTETPTETPTVTATSSLTQTPTETPTGSISPSVTPTDTETATISPTVTETPLVSETPTPTGSVTPTASGTPGAVATAATIPPSLGIADPVIVKLVNPELALPGEIVVFSITVTNTGTIPATGVVVSDTVPDMLTVLSATTTRGTFIIAGQLVTFDIGTVNPGEVIAMTITTRVVATVIPPQEGLNVAYLYWNEGPPRTSTTPFGSRSSQATVRIVSRLPGTGIGDSRINQATDGLWLEFAALTGAFFLAIYLVRRQRKHIA